VDEQARGLVLFDFDGTLFRLATDWGRLRADLERIAGEQGVRVDGAGIVDLALAVDADEVVVQAELDGLAGGSEVAAGIELYRRHAAEGARLAVVTHNSREVVDAFFAARDLPRPERIFDRKALGALKPESGALDEYAAGAATVVVGDTSHDRRLAERLGAEFVDGSSWS
jgi:phosphoglycolate phosphatase-like HAD superfamily hydrolase